MKKLFFVMVACAMAVCICSCERVKKSAAGKQTRVVQAEAVINPYALAGEWADSTKNAMIALDGEGTMSGKVGDTEYSQWIVAHENMLLFRGQRGGAEVVDTAMLDANKVHPDLSVAAVGCVFTKK
ncbi:MAG: hypothetical protein K5893_05935 [Prevotella sp.]|nr:hypothetical protein [Prevotella sp.]